MTKSKSKSKSKSASASGAKAGQHQASKDTASTSTTTTTTTTTTTITNAPDSTTTANDAASTTVSGGHSIPVKTLSGTPNAGEEGTLPPIDYVSYESEHQLQGMITLIENDLSEPYSIYTYRYFLHQWPKLSFLAMDREKAKCIGVIVCRLEPHGHIKSNRGYIAMLAVSKEYRKRRIGSTLVLMAIEAMKTAGADEIVLETEYTNTSAIALYQQMGFIKDKRLYRYYLNGVDAFRLKLFCKSELEEAASRARGG
ncbi:N-alpha-acetyltransferase 30, NatC catalytic subunit-like protein [Dissophora ornata]|nr:hypothetical protein BGZ58_011089 [Dissophora ornata]KAI8597806.1 N-alpha-acetyltransferase 30, NatC catalytic subunit-like protein [Dissophora ornata]